MTRETKNLEASIRARLLNVARETKREFQLVLTHYALERLLYRLSVSPFSERFVLKGALLFTIWLDDPLRPTRDLDLLGRDSSEPEQLTQVFRAILRQPVEADGLVFGIADLQTRTIREHTRYGGMRVETTATLERARIPIQIDIGFGDAITPHPNEVSYPSLLGMPSPRLRAYPRETVIAEKLEALVSLGFTNSRMKDFFDILMIARNFDFDGETLAAAVRATFARRQTPLPVESPDGLSDAFAAMPDAMARWRAFTRRDLLTATPSDFHQVVSEIRAFLLPVIAEAHMPGVSPGRWAPGGPWRR
jgi:predicted nucleotidyltransferase component of viral defense system